MAPITPAELIARQERDKALIEDWRRFFVRLATAAAIGATLAGRGRDGRSAIEERSTSTALKCMRVEMEGKKEGRKEGKKEARAGSVNYARIGRTAIGDATLLLVRSHCIIL